MSRNRNQASPEGGLPRNLPNRDHRTGFGRIWERLLRSTRTRDFINLYRILIVHSRVKIIPAQPSLFQRGIELFAERGDKEEVFRVFGLVIALAMECVIGSRAATLYAPDPDHSWNQVYEVLMVRMTGDGLKHDDLLDPPYWTRTKYLLEGDSNERAVKALVQLTDDAEGLKQMSANARALMQRDLIGIFSWLTGSRATVKSQPTVEEQRLAKALIRAIRHTALAAEEIRALPDNFAAALARWKGATEFDGDHPERPFLPKNLLADDGEWIALEPVGDDSLAATLHFQAFKGRSAFEVRMRHPTGRAAGEAYLRTLAKISNRLPLRYEAEADRWVEPEVSQLEPGTSWALVRRAILADREGNPVLSPIVESIQIRTYRNTWEFASFDVAAEAAQAFVEWELRRKSLLSGGGFHLTKTEDEPYMHFMRAGFDPFETTGGRLRAKVQPAVRSCFTCHNAAGIHSVLSRSRRFEEASLPVEFRVSDSVRIAQTAEENARRLPNWTLLQWWSQD